MRIWRIYRTLFLLIIWTYVVLGYYLDQCQSPYQWNLRAKDICSVSSANYSCLYNVEQKKYNESCDLNADYVKPGYRYVIKGTGRANGNCSHSRYQPIKFWSNRSSECEFLKNKCNEIGQVIFSNRSSTKDRSCRCDYTNGFDFVVQPINVCYCIPSEEDCSCYRKMCSPGKKLTKDYVCHSNLKKDVTGGRCSIINTRKPSITSSSTSRPILANSDNHKEQHMKTVILVLSSICIMFLSILTIVVCIAAVPNNSIYLPENKSDNANSIITDRQRQEVNNTIHEQDQFNIISVNKSFLMEEMDITFMCDNLKLKRGLDFEFPNKLKRKEKANIICESLEKEPRNIIVTIIEILEEGELYAMRDTLMISAKIFGYTNEENLKYKIFKNKEIIVERITEKRLVGKIILVLKEKDSLRQHIDAECEEVDNDDKKQISKLIEFVMKDGLHSMLQFVYALLIVEEEEFVTTLIENSN